MSIGPILPGRLPDTLLAQRLQQNLQTGNRILANLNDQLVTGQQYFIPSESPAAAIRSIILQKTLERKEQIQGNIQIDQSFLSASEAALGSVSDALIQAKSFVTAGIGDSSSPAEKQAMAIEAASLLRSVVNVGNTKFRGRYLFSGSESQKLPFELIGGSTVRYNGDEQKVNSFIDLELLMANNVDGNTAFGALTKPVGNDINPALTLNTKIADLMGGQGVQLGSITVSLNSGAQTLTVDISKAETVGDLKTVLENAFAAGPPTLTVAINSANNGLQLSSSTGNIVISDVTGSTVASDLGIAGTNATQIVGTDLNPRLTIQTTVASLNGGTGIGATSGNGLFITNGSTSKAVDLDGATTIEDVFNRMISADLDLSVGFNQAGNGLAISSRLSGTNFSIGENNGANAAGLGIRTLDGNTLLSDLNFGVGVPVTSGINLPITLRDGTSLSVDLSSATTVQNVLDTITAASGSITAVLNPVGSGITVTDSSLVTLNTPITSLKAGLGVSLGSIVVSLNSGADVQTVDLTGSLTLNDVKTRLEAAFVGGAPPTLTVSINSSNNGLQLASSVGDVTVTDQTNSAVAANLGIAGGPSTPLVGSDVDAALVIDINEISDALGIGGKKAGGGASVALTGTDIHARETNGAITILARIEAALTSEDDRELERIAALIDKEILRFNQVRGEVGNRLKNIDNVENRILDEELELREALSKDFDADLTEVITQVVFQQQALEAALQVAATSLRLNLLAFL